MKKYIDTGKKDTRSGFGEGLAIAGRQDERVLALTADLKGSLKMGAFAKEFPERFIPGASPPEVNTPMRFTAFSILSTPRVL